MRIRYVLLLVAFCLLATSPALAQDDPDPLWIDVNFGAAFAAGDGYTASVQAPFRTGTLQYRTEYDRPTGGSFDMGVGYMFHPRWGLGLSLLAAVHPATAMLSVSVPDPFVLNRTATDSEISDRESFGGSASFNMQAVFKLTPVESRFVARVFGGPTYFAGIQEEAIGGFSISELVDLSTGAYVVDIDDFEYGQAEGNGWGFHVGADAAHFFTNHVGVGSIIRVDRGTVDLVDPLLADNGDTVETTVGGVQFGFGLRLKF